MTRGFELMAHELTQGEFSRLMAWNPSGFRECGLSCPVETVSWYDALAYANRLSDDVGLEECYALTSVVCEDGGNVGTSGRR